MTPVDIITSGIESTQDILYEIGLMLITRLYNAHLEKRYERKHSIIMEKF